MTNKLPVIKHLNDSEQALFLNTQLKHLHSMGLSEQKHYMLSEITKVKRNTDEICLEVYYSNGEWFKYYPNGTLA